MLLVFLGRGGGLQLTIVILYQLTYLQDVFMEDNSTPQQSARDYSQNTEAEVSRSSSFESTATRVMPQHPMHASTRVMPQHPPHTFIGQKQVLQETALLRLFQCEKSSYATLTINKSKKEYQCHFEARLQRPQEGIPLREGECGIAMNVIQCEANEEGSFVLKVRISNTGIKTSSFSIKSEGFSQEDLLNMLNRLQIKQKLAILAYDFFEYIEGLDKETFFDDREQRGTPIGVRALQHMRRKRLGFQKDLFIRFNKLINASIEYPSDAFSQQRFSKALTGKSQVTFFPSFMTKQILTFLLKFSRSREQQSILYGASGIGKSWTFLFFHQLYKDIEVLLFNQGLQSIRGFVDMKIALYLPKVFYYSIHDLTDFSEFVQMLLFQAFQGARQHANQGYGSLSKLRRLLKFYQSNSIPVVVLIDQINFYYSLLRQASREKQAERQSKNATKATEIIIQKLRELNVKVMFSSSLNVQSLKSLGFTGSASPMIQIQSIRSYLRLEWVRHSQERYGFYEILHFIQFQLERLESKQATKTYFYSQFFKQIFADESTPSLFHTPLTFLQIRQALSNPNPDCQSILSIQKPQLNIFLNLLAIIQEDSVKKLVLQLKKSFYSTSLRIQHKKHLMYQLSKLFLQSFMLGQEMVDTFLFEDYTTKLKRILQFYRKCSQQQQSQQQQVFYHSPRQIYLAIKQTLADQALFSCISQAIHEFLLQQSDKCANLVDLFSKSFSYLFAQHSFELKFTNIRQKNSFSVIKPVVQPQLFRPFCYKFLVKRKQTFKKSQARCSNILTAQSSNDEKDDDQSYCPNRIYKFDQKLCPQIRKFTGHFLFFDRYQWTNKNQWIGALPLISDQDAQQYGSAISCLLLKKNNAKKCVQIVTIGFCLSESEGLQVCRRFQKAKVTISMIETVARIEEISVELTHYLIIMPNVKESWNRHKQKHSQCELNAENIKVVSLMQVDVVIHTQGINVCYFNSIREILRSKLDQKLGE